jgi:hypothetical protein
MDGCNVASTCVCSKHEHAVKSFTAKLDQTQTVTCAWYYINQVNCVQARRGGRDGKARAPGDTASWTIFESLSLSLSPHRHTTSQSISISILRPASLLYYRTQTFPPPPQYPARSLSALASVEPSIYPRAALSSYSCPPAAARFPTLFSLLYHVLQAS